LLSGREWNVANFIDLRGFSIDYILPQVKQSHQFFLSATIDHMGRRDWFRSTVWDPQTEQEFLARLARSRSDFKKAQYLRIQGLTLIMKGDPALIRTGMQLTRRVLDEFPAQRTETAACWSVLGDAHEKLVEREHAINAYRQAWAMEQTFPHARTRARDQLALLIVKLDLREHAEEALRAVNWPRAQTDERLFPFIAVQWALVRASIASWKGDHTAAKQFAQQGLAAVSLPPSASPCHPKLGRFLPKSEHAQALERFLTTDT
jgi:hypothetical protein